MERPLHVPADAELDEDDYLAVRDALERGEWLHDTIRRLGISLGTYQWYGTLALGGDGFSNRLYRIRQDYLEAARG